MMRVFLGIALPDEVRSALAVQQFLLPLPRKADVEQLHLTLVFLGEVSDALLESAHEGFAALQAEAFALSLRGFGLFGGERPRAFWAAVAPSDPLMRLQARAERAARMAGCRIEARRFAPHVTLGRFAPPPFPVAARLEQAVVAGAGFTAGPWLVDEMVLWQSRPTARGRRHEELTRYQLRKASSGTVPVS
jgi:RNA 2',3'-cyclic 3'-phosphodiesterase